jgi:hypothetical protein
MVNIFYGLQKSSIHQLKQKCPPWFSVEEVDEQICEHQDAPKAIHNAARQMPRQNAVAKQKGTAAKINKC